MYLSRNQMKLMAIILMLIDHTGYFLLGNLAICRAIGRLSFPLFVYLLMDGCRRTRNIEKYAFRILLCWLISIVPYSLALYHSIIAYEQNIFLSLYLFLGLFCILENKNISIHGKGIIIVLLAIGAELWGFSYGWYGVALAIILYYYEKLGRTESFQNLLLLSFVYCTLSQNYIQFFAVFCILLLPDAELGFKKDKRPSPITSLMSYLFYPLHLLFFAVLLI